MKQSKFHILFSFLYIMLIWQSCALVPLCDEDTHPHSTYLLFDFDWTGYESEKPEQMYVLLNRIINTKHYVFPIEIESENSTEKENSTDENAISPYRVEGGEYSVLAINLNENYTDLKKVEEFENNTSMSLNEIEISLTSYDKSELEEMKLSSWTDFNPTYRYIKAPEMIFIGTDKINVYNTNSKRIQMRPLNLSQRIKFRFGLKPDDSIEITNIVGEISGTIGRIKVLSLEAEDTETYRMSFYPQMVEEEDGILIYEGEINTLGILSNINSMEMSGPGVMHLAIYVKQGDKKKVYHERINLINTITKANLTLPLEDGREGYRLNTNIKEKTLEIDSYLILDMEKVSTDKLGIDEWTHSENQYIDTEA